VHVLAAVAPLPSRAPATPTSGAGLRARRSSTGREREGVAPRWEALEGSVKEGHNRRAAIGTANCVWLSNSAGGDQSAANRGNESALCGELPGCCCGLGRSLTGRPDRLRQEQDGEAGYSTAARQ